jgi:hypothetical protein
MGVAVVSAVIIAVACASGACGSTSTSPAVDRGNSRNNAVGQEFPSVGAHVNASRTPPAPPALQPPPPGACRPTQVAHSNKASPGSIRGQEGDLLSVQCDEGYQGGGSISCHLGKFPSGISCTAKRCAPTQVPDSSKATPRSITGKTGDRVSVVCNAGAEGGGIAICGTNGVFSIAGCKAQECEPTQVMKKCHIHRIPVRFAS